MTVPRRPSGTAPEARTLTTRSQRWKSAFGSGRMLLKYSWGWRESRNNEQMAQEKYTMTVRRWEIHGQVVTGYPKFNIQIWTVHAPTHTQITAHKNKQSTETEIWYQRHEKRKTRQTYWRGTRATHQVECVRSHFHCDNFTRSARRLQEKETKRQERNTRYFTLMYKHLLRIGTFSNVFNMHMNATKGMLGVPIQSRMCILIWSILSLALSLIFTSSKLVHV